MLKSYLTRIDTSIFPKRNYDNIFSERLVNELNDCIENHPHVIQTQNISDSLFVKINGTPVKKHKHLLQIPVKELHNNTILSIYQGGTLVQELWMENYVLEVHILGSTFQHIKKGST